MAEPSFLDFHFAGNPQDCQDKFRNCFVSYKGVWGYAQEYDRDLVVRIVPIGPGVHPPMYAPLKNTSHKDIQVGAYPLGMAKARENVYYLSRAPLRKNKLGLSKDNLQVSVVYEAPYVDQAAWTYLWGDNGTAFKNMFEGNYTPYRQACDLLLSGAVQAEPFSADFALVRVSRFLANIKYKTETVGETELKTGDSFLYPSSQHLQQRLDLITNKG